MSRFTKQLLFIVIGITVIASGVLVALAVNNRGADPVAWWKFDEGYASTTYDASGSNDGTLTGGVQWKNEDDCKIGKCLYFDGNNDYINVGNISANIQTITFWLRPASTTDGVFELVNNTNYISIASSAITTTGFTSPTIYVNGIANKTSLILNQWNFVAITTSSSITAASVVIGEANGDFTDGYIDDVKMYDYARSAAQIKADYLASAGGKGAGVKVGSAQEARDASEGLIAHWDFDETALNACGTANDGCDSSGNLNHLTAIADAAPTSTAKYGYAATFDGTGDYYCSDPDNDGDCDDDDDLDMGTSDFTIEAWVKVSSSTANFQAIVNKHSNAGSPSNAGTGFLITTHSTANGHVRAYIRDGTTGSNNTLIDGPAGYDIRDGNWHHIVFVADRDSQAKTYVDSVAGSYKNISHVGSLNNSVALYIGRTVAGYDFPGQIDDVKIYKTARTASQVRKDYLTGPPPVAHWKMDEGSGDTSYDTAGSNNGNLNGTCPGGAKCPVWSNGKYGKSLRFDGSDDGVLTSLGSDAISKGFTVGAWVNSQGPGATLECIVCRYAPYRFMVVTSSRAPQFRINTNSVQLAASTALKYNKWYYLTGTYDGSKVRIYVNGVEENSSSYTAEMGTTGSTWIGIQDNSNNYPFNGLIDDVKIYNYARTPRQIVEDMNAGHPVVGSPVGSYVGYWTFDEGYGTTAYDMSIFQNNLTISTTSAWTTAGKFGKAFANAAGKQYTYRSDDPDFDFAATEDFSVSLWFKSNSATNPSGVEYLIRKASGSAGWAMYLATTTGKVGFATDDDTTWSPDDSAVSTDDFYDATWHHVVGVKTGTTSLELFVDGVKRASDTSIIGNETLANSAGLYIGDSTGSDSGDEFKGTIDEVKIYQFALTPEEVLLEYNSGATLKLGSLSAPPTGGAGAGTSTDSALLEYCVPGGTDQCDPPVAHWKFDEKTGTSAYDTSGSTNTGTLTNGPVWKSAGQCHQGSCLSFDGTDDYVSVSNFNVNYSNITVSFWFNTTDVTTVNRIIEHSWGTGIFSFHFNSGTLYGTASTTVATPQVSFGSVQTNVWYYVSMTYDGSNLKGYLNGVLKNTTADANGLNSVSTTLYIGSRGSYVYPGKLDDVRIYNYARTPAQIAWEYNRGAPVGWWKMDEGQDTATTCNATGATVYDYSGNGNNGTLDLNGSPATSTARVEGKFNCALDFDGVNDKIVVAAAAALSDLSAFTISAWVNPFDDAVGSYIMSKTNSANGIRKFLTLDSAWGAGSLEGKVLGSTSAQSISANNTITLGVWQHITMTWSTTDNLVRLYVNGSEVSYDTQTVGAGPLTEAGTSWYIGGRQGSASVIEAAIDEVRIYNYALTLTQIKTLYNQGSAVRFGPSEGLP